MGVPPAESVWVMVEVPRTESAWVKMGVPPAELAEWWARGEGKKMGGGGWGVHIGDLLLPPPIIFFFAAVCTIPRNAPALSGTSCRSDRGGGTPNNTGGIFVERNPLPI